MGQTATERGGKQMLRVLEIVRRAPAFGSFTAPEVTDEASYTLIYCTVLYSRYFISSLLHRT